MRLSVKMTTANSSLDDIGETLATTFGGESGAAAESAFGAFAAAACTDSTLRQGLMNIKQPTYESIKSSTIMIVDDEPINVKIARRYLHDAGYKNFITITDAPQAFDSIRIEQPDVILMDIVMPRMSGLWILELMRNDPRMRHIPVIILTAASDPATKLKALDLGAADFLSKPVDPTELAARVRNSLLVKAHQDQLANYSVQLEHEVRLRTAALESSRQDVIHCLASAAECRDDVTGYHIIRVGTYAAIVSRRLGYDNAWVELIEQAAKLHDVGKIGIPDAILLKAGKLDAGEYDAMKKHCELGLRIIQPWSELRGITPQHTVHDANSAVGHSPIMVMAARIAYTHHEKWDGSGYPRGLSGEDIPIEGRITAVADVFDALSSLRPYKAAFSLARCFELLEEGRGKHFDPRVLDAFFASTAEVVRVMSEYAD